MNISDALDKYLREKTALTNLIETLWLLFAAGVKIPPGGVQWVESRRCFFAGALTMFEATLRILEPGTEPTDADLARMSAIANELERFGKDLAARLA